MTFHILYPLKSFASIFYQWGFGILLSISFEILMHLSMQVSMWKEINMYVMWSLMAEVAGVDLFHYFQFYVCESNQPVC